VLDTLTEAVRGGRSQVLVVRGEPGVGKTAILERAIGSVSEAGFRVARATGIESEMELSFAGLHQLLAPMLERLEELPAPQRDAMNTAFGLAGGRAPDRFLIGLAVLGLLSDAAEAAPLLCVIDDAHWLDRASAHALAFAARRLLAEHIGLVFVTRHLTEDLRGLPEVTVEGLGDADARVLLSSVVGVPLDARVRDRIIAETRGNPLALLEWPRGLTPADLTGGFGLPNLPMAGLIEESFRRRLDELPPPAKRFVTVAAAEPTGDAVTVWRAAAQLGVGPLDASPAIEAGLVEVDTTVRFRHPTVRTAAYTTAATDDRRAAHRALAEVTDAEADPDRRAWHLALAAAGPDEEVAAELERSAGRAQGRGGLAAAAALLERSATLSLDPRLVARRALAAAAAHLEAGRAEKSAALLTLAEAGPLDEIGTARAELLRGYHAVTWGDLRDAATVLASAAKRLEAIDVGAASDQHAAALGTAVNASSLARGATVADTARAATGAPMPDPVRPHDLLLKGLGVALTDGPAAAVPMLQAANTAFGFTDFSAEEAVRWLGYRGAAATLLWDHESWHRFAARHVEIARSLGALATLPLALNALAVTNIFAGDLSTAALLVSEEEAVIEAIQGRFTAYAGARLAALRGNEREAVALIDHHVTRARDQGMGLVMKVTYSAAATLYNSLARYDQALEAAQEANRAPHTWASHLTLHELVEAAVRCGRPDVAAAAMDQLALTVRPSGTDWALGIEARSRALLSTGGAAETHYVEAINHLDRSPIRPEAARAHLLYGEWLRRQNRRVDARHQLRTAFERFTAMGMDAFAARAGRELKTTGETVRKRGVEHNRALTAQELQIARLAAEGCSNPEIGTQLFLSARTVEWHLGKVFAKLDVTSRNDLRETLPRLGPVPAT
jgi:DNA-binding CsgD family transcriptional regulator